MTESLGMCGAAGCRGEVLVERTVGGVAEGACPLCGFEYAAPVRHERVEPEKDWLETPDPWWKEMP